MRPSPFWPRSRARQRPTPGIHPGLSLCNLNDENQVVSFGFYDGTLEDLERIRDQQKEEERQSRMAEFVESTDVDAMFEVVDEVTPPAS